MAVADGSGEGEAAVSWEYFVDSNEVVEGYTIAYVLDDGTDSSAINENNWSLATVGGDARRYLAMGYIRGSTINMNLICILQLLGR